MKRLISALLLAVCCAGCTTSANRSSGSPSGSVQAAAKTTVPVAAPQDFAAGMCRAAAEHVVALGTMANALHGRAQADIAMADRRAMQEHQRAVIAMMPKADPALRRQLQDLVTAIGFARMRLDIRTYQPSLMDDVARAEAGIQATCVH